MASQGANLSYTKFLFILPRKDDEAFQARLRAAGGVIARSFFNDFDADGSREGQQRETIQFLVAEGEAAAVSGLLAARYVVQVCGKYRPRLVEVEQELRRRLGDGAEVLALEGAERAPRYTSAEMFEFAYRPALPRRPGRAAPNVPASRPGQRLPRARPRDGGAGRDPDRIPSPLPQPGWLRTLWRVRLHHVLRV
jgi:hypothetical protein